MTFTLGLDFGKVVDWTALSVLRELPDGRLGVVYLRRWKPERDDCADALIDTADVIERNGLVGAALALDARGLGRHAAQCALEGRLSDLAGVFPLLPTFTNRPPRQRGDGQIYVAKRDLIGTLSVLLEAGRLAVSPGLEEAPALRQELARLREIPTRQGTAVTWSAPPGEHDDLAMSVAMAAWLAERVRTQGRASAILPANRRNHVA